MSKDMYARRLHSRTVASAAALAVVTLVASACSSSGKSSGSSSSPAGSASGSASTSVAAGPPYQINVDMPLTGAFGAMGTAGLNGVESVFDLINSQGGVKGHKINYTVLDDQSSATFAPAAALKDVDGNPSVIIVGGNGYFLTAAATLAKAGIPALTAVAQTIAPAPWYYTDAGTTSQAADTQVQGANGLSSLSGQKVAIIAANSPSAQASGKQIAATATKLGATVVTTQTQTLGAASFSAGAQVIASSGAQYVFTADTTADIIVEAQALRSAGYKGKIFGNYLVGDTSTLETLADPGFYAARQEDVPASGDAMTAAAQKFGHTDGLATESFAQGWVNAYTAVQALTKCGYPCSATQMQTALDGLGDFTVPGQTVKLNLSPTNHISPTTFTLYTWDASKKAPVLAVKDAPMPSPVFPAATGS